jgi:hypothetical protein
MPFKEICPYQEWNSTEKSQLIFYFPLWFFDSDKVRKSNQIHKKNLIISLSSEASCFFKELIQNIVSSADWKLVDQIAIIDEIALGKANIVDDVALWMLENLVWVSEGISINGSLKLGAWGFVDLRILCIVLTGDQFVSWFQCLLLELLALICVLSWSLIFWVIMVDSWLLVTVIDDLKGAFAESWRLNSGIFLIDCVPFEMVLALRVLLVVFEQIIFFQKLF